MLYLAQSDTKVTDRLLNFNTDPWLLNCENGIIDLRTGMLRPHAREELLTRIVPVAYYPDARSDRWLVFLDRIMSGDQDLLKFVPRAAGYSLTASVREQVSFFCYGGG